MADWKQLRERVYLRWREAVQVNGIAPLQLAQKLLVPLQWQIGMETSLHQDPAATQFESLFHLLVNVFETQNVAFRRSGLAVERAESANRRAYVAIVNVSVDNVGDDVIWVQAP